MLKTDSASFLLCILILTNIIGTDIMDHSNFDQYYWAGTDGVSS